MTEAIENSVQEAIASEVEGIERDEPIMKFFKYEHLPDRLQNISKPFCETAKWVRSTLPNNAEKSVTLRKLLEAKDAAVRASL